MSLRGAGPATGVGRGRARGLTPAEDRAGKADTHSGKASLVLEGLRGSCAMTQHNSASVRGPIREAARAGGVGRQVVPGATSGRRTP